MKVRWRRLLTLLFLTTITAVGAALEDDPARLVVRPDSSTVADNAKIGFFCRADGNPLPNVVWKIDGKSVNDPRFSIKSLSTGISTLRIEPVRSFDNGTIVSCSADNGVANPVMAEAMLTVLPKSSLPSGFPQIEVHPTLKSVEQGKTAYVSCRVKGEPRAKVLWLRDQIPLDVRSEGRYSISTIGNPGALMIQNAREDDQGKYECIARNSLGVVHSKAAHLYVKVRRVPPYFSYKLEKSYTVGKGSNINLTCVAVGYPMPRVFWKKSDQVVLDDPSTAPIGKNVLSLSHVESTENFTCVAVSALGNIEATTTVLVKELPPAPQNFGLSSVTATSVTLTWEPPKTTEPVTKYIVTYKEKPRAEIYDYGGAGDEKYADTRNDRKKQRETTETSMVVDDLSPFQVYEFTVQTVGDVGAGDTTTPKETQTSESVPETPPTNVQARSLNRDGILVKWSASEKPNGQITGYKVYYTSESAQTPIQEWTIHETKADEMMATIYGLVPDTRYFFKVSAHNQKGDSPLSQLVTVSTVQGIPGQPPMLSAKPLDSRRIQLSWEKPMFSMPVNGYTVRYNTTEGEKEITLTSPHEKHVVSGLKPDQAHYFRVAAYSARGQGEFTEPIFAKTIASTGSDEDVSQRPVPSEPRNFNAELTSATSVKLTWDPPAHSNGVLIGFYIYHDKIQNGEPVMEKNNKKRIVMLRDAQKKYYEMNNLDPNTEYSFRMNAFNRNGDGEFTERKNVITQGIAPEQPEIVSVSLESEEAPVVAKIEWKTPNLRTNEGPIERFNLWLLPRDHNDEHIKRKVIVGTDKSATVSGLLMGVVYDVYLGAENKEGQSVNATETLVTPIGVPDGEPSGVQYEISMGKIVVSWTPPSEEKRNGNITSYKAILTSMDNSGDRFEKTVTSPSSSATFEVNVRRAYLFKVAALTMKGPGPFSPVLTINPDPTALVGPPANVRVEATSNSSAVIQWDFDAAKVDSFVVKYIHEPSSRADVEKWVQQPVLGHVRHFEVHGLNEHKPYAFCVLAVKNNRQGPCSDPPTVLDSVTPVYMVQNLKVRWKTSNSVKLTWDYSGPRNVEFYLNHTGKKEYLNHEIQLKTMTTPGFEQKVNERTREYLWTNLRPHMQYTFHIGVRSLPPGVRQFWPKEVTTTTDATGPPFVEVPHLLESSAAPGGQTYARLFPATEEYGEISHYWLIVVPANYSNEDMLNVDSSDLERVTIEKKASYSKQMAGSKKLKRSLSDNNEVSGPSLKRRKRSAPNGAYVTAKLSSTRVREDFASHAHFSVGDGQTYDGYFNYPLEPGQNYRLMMRAFAKADIRGKDSFEQRAPMSEKLSKLYSDSVLTEPFTSRSALRGGAAGSKPTPWLGTCIAFLVLFSILTMLICWWMRCNKKSAGGRHTRHGSITKVALPENIMNGMNGETSKLLASTDYGRVMNPYDQMNGNTVMESSMDIYPMPKSHSRSNGNSGGYGPVPVALPSLPTSNGNLAGGLTHPPIPTAKLADHIERLRMNSSAGFQQEFESIETGQHFTWENSNAEYNKHKNRYANVAAYDHTRVILSTMDSLPGSDYINANYIDGYEKARTYIATQGPLVETLSDFWRMVWEEGSLTIVMLTNLEERSRVKCDQYWPTRGTASYGDIQVTLLEASVLAHYTMRTLRLQMIGEPEMREIRHLQYTAWPDHGVPDHPTPFLMFLRRVKSLNPPSAGPIVTHCSAGIGRTGAYIVIDIMLERLRYDTTVDIYGCVTHLRSQRSYMVQTEEQYIFIHDAIWDAFNSGSTEIPIGKLHQHTQASMQPNMDNVTALEIEFKHLKTLKWANHLCQVANLPVNRHKNRVLSSVPYDSNRVILQMIPGIEGSDYINASWIDGYKERGAYIATQAPFNNTSEDFWRAIWEQECAIIVMLVNFWEKGEEKSAEYWPLENAVQLGMLVVEPNSEYDMDHYKLREFRLSDLQTGQSRTIRHFQFMEWPDVGRPDSAEHFIDFVYQVHHTKSQFGTGGPIAVHCCSGAGRTGVFIALATIMDRIRAEGVVDVFTAVKLLRTERQNMVQDLDQYEFLYQAACEFLALFDTFGAKELIYR